MSHIHFESTLTYHIARKMNESVDTCSRLVGRELEIEFASIGPDSRYEVSIYLACISYVRTSYRNLPRSWRASFSEDIASSIRGVGVLIGVAWV
jgi:hypothetical protein